MTLQLFFRIATSPPTPLYRNSFARSSIPRPSTYGNSFDPYAANERAGLIDSSDHVIELSILPPKWYIIRRIADESRLSSIASQEQSMSKNIQTRLAMKLQDLSSNFRKQQSSYMKKLKVRESRSSPLFSLDSRTSSDNTSDDLELGFTLEQRELVDSTEVNITQREQEINEIAKSIQELADIFRELQTFVIDQGTMLDRIDFNVEQMSVNVKSAVRFEIPKENEKS
ncbi:2590_t:CDS:2 [Ambispora gerdemannii]|uniref:2590_t:CDS:1 n=1 Tax=Ambispora gerdemannii TaxID=144530 RepID=A0A9N9CK03_9GLOM|nr:2590_t:CDS:2 [Ambispora gerdemannii]